MRLSDDFRLVREEKIEQTKRSDGHVKVSVSDEAKPKRKSPHTLLGTAVMD